MCKLSLNVVPNVYNSLQNSFLSLAWPWSGSSLPKGNKWKWWDPWLGPNMVGLPVYLPPQCPLTPPAIPLMPHTPLTPCWPLSPYTLNAPDTPYILASPQSPTPLMPLHPNPLSPTPSATPNDPLHPLPAPNTPTHPAGPNTPLPLLALSPYTACQP